MVPNHFEPPQAWIVTRQVMGIPSVRNPGMKTEDSQNDSDDHTPAMQCKITNV